MVESIAQAMKRSSFYDQTTGDVELRETHISWLFFAGDRVYKVKKPVDFGFLDFTTLARRKAACEKEFALNRRLTTDVYLEVAAIYEQDGRISFSGPGEVVEYAVVMRRLPDDRLLANLLKRGEVNEAMIRQIGERIGRFHRGALEDAQTRRLGGYEAVAKNIDENFEQTKRYIGKSVTNVQYMNILDYSKAVLSNEKLFEQRGDEGWIRDTHGDLHAEQIFVEERSASSAPGAKSPSIPLYERGKFPSLQRGARGDFHIQIIDAIEFNDRFRYQDVASDIAFLTMDLRARGHKELVEPLMRSYERALGAQIPSWLLRFYEIYRAYVRGKIMSLQSNIEAAKRYFTLSHALMKSASMPIPGLTHFRENLGGSGNS